VVIPTGANERITPSNDSQVNGPAYDRGYLYLFPGDCTQIYVAADGMRVLSYFRNGHVPGLT
jgi:hypothetical protein